MLFSHLRDAIFRESPCGADEGGPKSAMNQADLPFDQPAYQDIA